LGHAGTYALLIVAAALRRSVLRAADEKEEEGVSIFWIVFFAVLSANATFVGLIALALWILRPAASEILRD
jgi:hypothetical protein